MLKSKIFINTLKTLIVVLSYSYISWKLYHYDNISEILLPLQHFSTTSLLLIFSLIILMLLNWSLETFKWRFLIKKIEEISFKKSFIGVLAGISVSIFLINRVGEFGGRIFVLKRENRVAAISSTLLGNIAQIIVIVIAGGIAFVIWAKHQTHHQENMLLKQYLSYFIFVISAFFIWLMFDMQRIKQYLLRYKFFTKHANLLKMIDSYSSGELFIVLAISAARYLVFSFQFYLALKLFMVDISLYNAQLAIALTYLVMTAIPTIGAVEFGVRGSVALFFIGMFSSQTAGIVTASIFIWILNLAIPALAGSYFVMKLKV